VPFSSIYSLKNRERLSVFNANRIEFQNIFKDKVLLAFRISSSKTSFIKVYNIPSFNAIFS
jgi:hypothetical protein